MAETSAVTRDPSSREWHALSSEEVVSAVASGNDGLTEAEAGTRLLRYGENRLPPRAGRGALRRLLSQFDNILIYVLLASALITILLGHLTDTLVILGVVVINALIGFLQEGKAEEALEAIRNLLSPSAAVMREGRRRTIPAELLVPGDIVFLQSGDRVPADLRLLRVHSLRIDEAALTGESVPVDKSIEPVASNSLLGDRTCLAFSGTLVTYGTATGIVVETGGGTELGRVSRLLESVKPLTTPLLRKMGEFSRLLTWWIVLLSVATFAFGVRVRGYSFEEMFLAAVGLAVAAIPEGLPAVITITLAIGVQRMARRNAIIRRLPAVETLGSVSVICTDKTGTLTRNEMTVQSVVTAEREYAVSGEGYDPHGGFSLGGRERLPEDDPVLMELCRGGVLCNDASLLQEGGRWQLHGDPTEGALVTLALKAGLDPQLTRDELPRTDAIPFESEHCFMATLHHDHLGHGFIVLKGAPERLLARCSQQRRGEGTEPIDRLYWHSVIDRLAHQGQRLLAVATNSSPYGRRELSFADAEGGLTMLGIAGLIDPPRPEAVAAVAQCRQAGIVVKMITGDHAATARAIGAQMGIGEASGRVITGIELATMDEASLREAVRDVHIFARTSPEEKLLLVEALQAEGKVIAMTGDGVNDAPALRRADVGVAMGVNGTEVAKEAAEVVLADDNFASIARAVEEGRTVYANIKKSILFILPTNGGEALTVVAAILLGWALPLTPLQILWVNMITAVTLALALAFEPGETDVMRERPRPPNEPLLTPLLAWRVVVVSLLLVVTTFGLFLWEELRGSSIDEARTVAVNALVVADIFYLFNTRHIYQSSLCAEAFWGNRYVLGAVAIVLLFQLLFTYAPPMQHLFATTSIDLGAWGRIVLAGAAVFLLVEAEKAVVTRLIEARR